MSIDSVFEELESSKLYDLFVRNLPMQVTDDMKFTCHHGVHGVGNKLLYKSIREEVKDKIGQVIAYWEVKFYFNESLITIFYAKGNKKTHRHLKGKNNIIELMRCWEEDCGNINKINLV